MKINIFSARPGIVIGKRGAGVEGLKKKVQRMTDSEVFLNIQEVRKMEVNAQLVAENICQQLERRIAYRRALKRAVQTAMKFGAKGIRVNAQGRLGGAEMGRREWYLEGRIPLHTLRADIDYGSRLAPRPVPSASSAGSSRARSTTTGAEPPRTPVSRGRCRSDREVPCFLPPGSSTARSTRAA